VNPFALPQRSSDDFRPLCPWECAEHERYYIEVDHTQAAFEEFQAAIQSNPGSVASGSVVLASGSEGCGKTALIHRCAFWLRSWIGDHQSKTLVILDLTREGLQGTATPGRVEHICGRIIDQIEIGLLFKGEAELKLLEKRRSDPAKLYPILGQLLANNAMVLAVLLPPIEVADEIKYYAGLAKPSIVFFCETSYDQVAQYCSSRFGPTTATPVMRLSVGVLSVDDGWIFVGSRLSKASQASQPLPVLSEATIRRLMEIRIKGRGKATVRELQMACLNVFEQAIAGKSQTVEFADFANYYTLRGSLT
jgi:hypothetical protein